MKQHKKRCDTCGSEINVAEFGVSKKKNGKGVIVDITLVCENDHVGHRSIDTETGFDETNGEIIDD